VGAIVGLPHLFAISSREASPLWTYPDGRAWLYGIGLLFATGIGLTVRVLNRRA
jgi:hypothetical protein